MLTLLRNFLTSFLSICDTMLVLGRKIGLKRALPLLVSKHTQQKMSWLTLEFLPKIQAASLYKIACNCRRFVI